MVSRLPALSEKHGFTFENRGTAGCSVPALKRQRAAFSTGALLLVFSIAVLFAGCGSGTGATPGSTATVVNDPTTSGGSPGASGVNAGSATLTWDAPSTLTDGTPLTGPLVYKLYYGTAPGQYTTVVEVGSATSYTVQNLAAGSYYFVVTACDILGYESVYSNEVSKTI